MTTALIRIALLSVCLLGMFETSSADDKPPRAIDDRLKIELFAEHPDIVTPTGIDVDHKGRVWAIESNTHFPPAGYDGHDSDRILVMQDSTGDHKADKIAVFADGLKHTMSVAVKPVWLDWGKSGKRKGESGETGASAFPTPLSAFVATRRAIWYYTDTDGDLKADKKKRIIQLDTKGDYPHNGLAGFAFDAMGWMYFGFGENLGADYKIIGSDGVTLKGGGEGGNVYRCRPDGSKLKQWATGFWNPHASCVDAFGRLFTVDNDPDSRPPCRLLHVIEGGDYGFRFSNGRKGLHPFTAWNGEIPGTLPMVSGTGEAPSGIVAYESDGFPKDYIGNLLVGSWGDHRIDRFRLKPRGASFESLPETIIQGGEDFRPVGLAVAPDGSLFLTDWVKRDYKLHGHGRVWRVSLKGELERDDIQTESIDAELTIDVLSKRLESSRLDVRRTAAVALRSTDDGRSKLLQIVGRYKYRKRSRAEALWSVAQVPLDVEDFGFMEMTATAPQIAGYGSELQVIAHSLFGTPQFPFDRHKQPIRQFLVAKSKTRSFFTKASPQTIANETASQNAGGRPNAYPQALAHAPLMIPHGEKADSYLAWLKFNESPFLFSSIVRIASEDETLTLADINAMFVGPYENPRDRPLHLALMLASKNRGGESVVFIRIGLMHEYPTIRRVAVQWAAEENIKSLRPQVEAILNSESMTTDLFLATLAALEMLDGKDPKDFDKTPAGKYVLPLVKDKKRSPAVRAQALRLVDENDPALDAKLMQSLLAQENAALQLEAVRSLQHSTAPFVGELLAAVAVDEQRPLDTRAEAVVGLAGRSYFPQRNGAVVEALDRLRKAEDARLQLEAVRSMRKEMTKTAKGRGVRLSLLRSFAAAVKNEPAALQTGGSHRALAEQLALVLSQAEIELPDVLQPVQNERPTKLAEWAAQLDKGKGDPAAGRRTFFHSQGAGCYRCHTINGRGEQIGPDLSRIGGALSRQRLIESIVEPSKEIAPQFVSWTFLMESGKVHVGMILGDTRDNKQRIGTPTGEVIELQSGEIEERHPQQKSLMPDNLHKQLTVTEFRDLLAYLESLK